MPKKNHNYNLFEIFEIYWGSKLRADDRLIFYLNIHYL